MDIQATGVWTSPSADDPQIARIVLLSLPLLLGLSFLEASTIFLLVLCCLLFAVLAYYHFEDALLLMLFLAPFDMQRSIGSSYAVYADTLKILLLPGFLLHSEYRQRLLRSKFCLVFLGIFLFNVLLAVPRSHEFAWTAKLLFRQGLALSFGLMFATVIRTRQQLSRAVITIIVSAAVVGIHAMYQWALGGFGAFWLWLNPEIAKFLPWEGRATGPLGHPNSLGDFLTLCITLAMAVALSPAAKKYRSKWLMLAIACAAGGLLVSFSRAAWLASAGGLVMALLIFGNWRKVMYVGASVLVCVPIVLNVLGQGISERISSVGRAEIGRLFIWGITLQMFSQHPLVGIGYGNWRGYYLSFVTAYFPSLLQSPDMLVIFAHNQYLQVLSESGIIGFLLFVLPFGYLVHRALLFRAPTQSLELVCLRACGIAMVSALGCGFLFETSLDGTPSSAALFWAIAGLAIAALHLVERSPQIRFLDRAAA